SPRPPSRAASRSARRPRSRTTESSRARPPSPDDPSTGRPGGRCARRAPSVGIIVGVTRQPRLEIEYCTQCRWLLRAAWTAQELLTTFQKELGEVALVPGTGGVFEVRLGDETLWSRKERDGFPELTELKRLVRDRIAPERSLGHTDRAAGV